MVWDSAGYMDGSGVVQCHGQVSNRTRMQIGSHASPAAAAMVAGIRILTDTVGT